MKTLARTLLLLLALAACTPAPPPVETAPAPSQGAGLRSAREGVAAFRRVAARVEPVAEQVCREVHPGAPRRFCDFRTDVLMDPRDPPNAYQTIGRDGRPVITFNVNMLRTVRNDHEIAFIFAHEAGHQIARHIEQTRANALAGALLGGLIVAAGGGDPSAGMDLGAQIGVRTYSKTYELEADALAAQIAWRAGYSPEIGARSFEQTRGSRALLSTHPPSSERLARVNAEIARIRAAEARGQVPPIRW